MVDSLTTKLYSVYFLRCVTIYHRFSCLEQHTYYLFLWSRNAGMA